VDTEVAAAITGAVSGGVISVVGTIISQWLSGRERERMNVRLEKERADERTNDLQERTQAKREEFLFRALEHFGGHTQERSVGIAIAEAYWKSTPEQLDVLVPLLLNQLVYLLAVQPSNKTADAAHERQNVRRIAQLLARIDKVDRFRDSYEFSLRAIERKRAGRGIDLSPDPEIKSGVDQFLGNVAAKLRAEPSQAVPHR
jgi:hypothetical protein